MVKLGGFRLSNYFNKVRIVLLEKGIAHQEENIFFSQDEGFRKRSPMGKVPFLEVDGGVIMHNREGQSGAGFTKVTPLVTLLLGLLQIRPIWLSVQPAASRASPPKTERSEWKAAEGRVIAK